MVKRRLSCLAVFSITMLIIISSFIVYAGYVEWLLVSSSVNLNGVDYPVIDAKGVATIEYDTSIGPYVYSMYYIYNSSLNHNYTVLRQSDSSGNTLRQLLLYSTTHINVKPGEIEFAPSDPYIAAVMYGEKSSGDSDGFIFLADANISSAASLVYDGFGPDTNYTILWDVYFAVNNEIYVAGEVYNDTSGWFQGLIIVYKFNGTHIFYDRAMTYIYSDPDGVSNDVLITDVIVGPDGYLYATMYIPWFNNGVWYDYKGVLAKIDPVSLRVVNTTTITAYNSRGVYQPATFTGSLAADEDSIYFTFNIVSEYYGAQGYSGAGLIAKLTPTFNVEWVRIIDDPDYNEYLYDVAVTSDNVTVIGMTNNNYGDTVFSDYNGFLVSFDPVSGDAKYGLLIGGSGYDQLKDPSISWEQKMYIIGVSESTSFYEKYLPASNLLIISSTSSFKEKTPMKPVFIKDRTRINPLYRDLIEDLSKIKERVGGRISYSWYGFKTRSIKGNKEAVALKKIEQLHGPLKAIILKRVNEGGRFVAEQSDLTPGILLKLTPSTGQQVSPPKPIPEASLYIIIAIIVAGAGSYLLYRRFK